MRINDLLVQQTGDLITFTRESTGEEEWMYIANIPELSRKIAEAQTLDKRELILAPPFTLYHHEFTAVSFALGYFWGCYSASVTPKT